MANRLVTDSVSHESPFSDGLIDALTAALFVGFVGVLFLGYLEPRYPYNGFASLPLLGSFATLFWGNLRSDRAARSPGPEPGV